MALWEQIRQAAVTKAETDVAALRIAAMGRRERRPIVPPAVFIGIPRGTMESRPGGATERYTLTYPCSLAIAAPGGEPRADTEAADLMYELLVSWRSGIQLGLGSSGVVGSWVSDWTPSYDANDLLDGYDWTLSVEVLETLNPTRSV